MKASFKVEGRLPPKKHGELSMWGQEAEVHRLVTLRRAASDAFAGKRPLSKNIGVKLRVHVGSVNERWTGDLDNFITGVCDGLMAADPRAALHPVWSEPGQADIHPTKIIGIEDDSQVVQIQAEKLFGHGDDPWYEVVLEGEQ